MSVNMNINKMNYTRRSYAECAEAEKRKINRILSVREQSNELAQKVLQKTRAAREHELKRIQNIKDKELAEWKKKTSCKIQNKIDDCIGNFGNAHIAAVDASCEEDESLRERRDEQDLMAAIRGRSAMLQVQREREREFEDKLLKKKRSHQKTVGIQADFLTQQRFSKAMSESKQTQAVPAIEISDEEEMYSTKPNPHKHSEQYNPQNFTSHSVDSSNNCDSDDGDIAELETDESVKDLEQSEGEFNQITNLLRNGLTKSTNNDEQLSISSDNESLELPPKIYIPKNLTIKHKVTVSPTKKKKGILKKSPTKSPAVKKNLKKQTTPVKSKTTEIAENRVRYIDYGNKYETSYIPDKNLVVRSEKTSGRNDARENAQKQTDGDLITQKINNDILQKLTDIRSQEALEKEKIRRDYEKLRLELDELTKQEQNLKAQSHLYQSLSRDQLLRKHETRQRKMNQAAEGAMKRNIVTCPPVAKEKSARPISNDLNVAAPSSSAQSASIARSNSELNKLVKIEKLKDLLEKINHQKRLLLNEIEKSDDVPGPDLEKVLECIKKLEAEKAALNQGDDKIDESKLKKLEELNEREKKVREREIRLENKLREMFRKQNEKILKSSSSASSLEPCQSETASVTSSESTKKIVQPPVEIIIKVQQPKVTPKKSRKSYRFVDTLSRQPGKVYPKTPVKNHKKSTDNEEVPLTEAEKPQRETQTSPVEAPRPILKNSQLKQISISPKEQKSTKQQEKVPKTASIVSNAPSAPSTTNQQKQSLDPEDYSQSTVYRDLPPQINLMEKEPKKKLNPLLIDYITRLLGMNKNIGNQLNVDVSSITTPGSSTINTSDNISLSTDVVNFNEDRMSRLQKFIDDNHSFISELSASLENIEAQKKQNESNEKVVEGLWKDILRQKKSSPTGSQPVLKKASSSAGNSVQNSKKQAQIPQKEPKKCVKITGSQSVPESSQSTESKTTQRPKITQNDVDNVSKYIESQMLNNYSEYTANCQRRISELTQMMEKVRQEKLKLIENSLSSNEFNNFTEYKDIAQTTNNQLNANPSVTGSSDPKGSPSNKDDPPSEEINNILQYQTRPFGVSKDSGISVSRPVTSSDCRESPDVRLTSEENNNNLFQPILKDIPKVSRMKVTAVDGETQTIKDASSIIRQQQEEKQQKKVKPPLSLKSPQFEKQHEPHELSTILEIETPTASRVLIQEEPSGVGNMQSFPNFEDYAQGNDRMSFPDLSDLKRALPDIKIQTFVGPNVDDVSMMEESKENPSAASSLMDIMGELKKRGLFEESFDLCYEEDHKDDRVEAVYENDDKTTPTATKQVIAPPLSPKRKPAQARIITKTPDNLERVEEVTKTPTKKKHAETHHKQQSRPHSPISNDTLSGIQEIERDFQTHGMGWAASTLKKTEDCNRKQSSSSSSSDKQDSVRIDFILNESSSSSGQPLNLKDFLRRELLSRSQNKEKVSSEDSSLSSQFMRSLLKTSDNTFSSSSSSNAPKSSTSQNAKLRTSTPVRISSENLVKTAASSQIFVGAESMSTVKESSASSNDKSDKSKSL